MRASLQGVGNNAGRAVFINSLELTTVRKEIYEKR
jgi:hypothetical protein